MKNNSIIEKSKSALIAKKIFFEKMLFSRNSLNADIVKFTNSSIWKDVELIKEETYKSSLSIKMTDDNDTSLEITVSGIFCLEDNMESTLKNIIITKNSIAILFPYLRSQVTLMTSQPDMEPVVLPPININLLLDNMEK